MSDERLTVARQPRERPLLFSAPMVRAILDGSKTQTRRVVKPAEARCPYGLPGDRLVLLSSWATDARYDGWKPTEIAEQMRADAPMEHGRPLIWTRWDGGEKPGWCGKLRPGRFMPATLRHILPRAEIADVHVVRLHNISNDDIRAEGVTARVAAEVLGIDTEFMDVEPPMTWWRSVWTAINGAESWEANPWLWAITFRRINA